MTEKHPSEINTYITVEYIYKYILSKECLLAIIVEKMLSFINQ